MVSKVKKLIGVILGAILCFSLMGCAAQVDVYESADEDNWYFLTRTMYDESVVQKLELTATKNEFINDSVKYWTLSDWLNSYFKELARKYDMTVESNGRFVDKKSGKLYDEFKLTVPKGGNLKDALTLDGDRKISTNFFIRTIDVTRQDRFNYFQKQFLDAYSRYGGKNEVLQTDYGSPMGMILFGGREYFPDVGKNDDGYFGYIYDDNAKCCYREHVPPLDKAFPEAKKMLESLKDIRLRNFWQGSDKMKVENSEKIKLRGGGAYYLLEKDLMDGETNVNYAYYRADARGWYIAAILVGALTVAIIIFVTRKNKKNKTQPQEQTITQEPPQPPLDPFDNKY